MSHGFLPIPKLEHVSDGMGRPVRRGDRIAVALLDGKRPVIAEGFVNDLGNTTGSAARGRLAARVRWSNRQPLGPEVSDIDWIDSRVSRLY